MRLTQSRRMSLAEALTNVAVGYTLNLAAQLVLWLPTSAYRSPSPRSA